ncbi:helix-turn-helix domain-containing protein [Evansella clarkii]|uniref:helix-turn-helix domain-containing protein n=1 Tax=Evansella clarkii TaxID=79879 RepID=UPI000997C1DA|nr:helix-turn-helix domain-containing protein [Evansella clarkii]
MNEISNVIRELRGKDSLRSAAKKIGISHSYLSMLESGLDHRTKAPIKPSPDTLRAISEAYNYPYKKLLEIAGYIEPEENNYDPLEDLKQYMIENNMQDMDFGFFDIEKWKKLGPDEIDEVKRHFEWVAAKAEQMAREEEERKKKK